MRGFLTWLRATLHGEVSAAELGARRGAGTAAYSLAEEAAAAAGTDRGARLFRACAWNAFALQTIADLLIETDAADDPGTAGYVPRSTLDFVSRCVDCVPEWIRLARVVQSDPDARIRGLPAALPEWHTDESTRPSELRALRAAYEALEARVESDLQALAASAPGDAALARIRRTRADMKSAADYSNAVSLVRAGPVDRGEARWRLLSALESAFALGQLIALPSLVDVARAGAAPSALVDGDSWLSVRSGWPVVDRDGRSVGFVQRVRGDRDTGEFEGVDVSSGISSETLSVPASSVSTIDAGEIRLSVSRAQVAGANG